MRKIGIVAVVVFVASWMFSLFCMHAAGQAGGTLKEENGSVVSGESVLDGYAQTGVERSVSGQAAGWDSNGDSQDSGKTAGWNGNSHSADQGDGEVYSRRIILERYGVRTYLSVEDYLPGVMVCQTGPTYTVRWGSGRKYRRKNWILIIWEMTLLGQGIH